MAFEDVKKGLLTDVLCIFAALANKTSLLRTCNFLLTAMHRDSKTKIIDGDFSKGVLPSDLNGLCTNNEIKNMYV